MDSKINILTVVASYPDRSPNITGSPVWRRKNVYGRMDYTVGADIQTLHHTREDAESNVAPIPFRTGQDTYGDPYYIITQPI